MHTLVRILVHGCSSYKRRWKQFDIFGTLLRKKPIFYIRYFSLSHYQLKYSLSVILLITLQNKKIILFTMVTLEPEQGQSYHALIQQLFSLDYKFPSNLIPNSFDRQNNILLSNLNQTTKLPGRCFSLLHEVQPTDPQIPP